MTLVAADSKPFTRTYYRRDTTTAFKGCLGVCLTLQDSSSFKELYANLLNEVFVKIGKVRQKMAYSSHELSEIYGSDREGFLQGLESMVKGLGQSTDLRINVVYTVLNTLIIPQGLKYYGKGRYPIKTVKPLEFLDDLGAYYPYVAAWKVTKSYKIVGTEVILDNFSGEVSQSWTELAHNHKVTVIPNGDVCNQFISAADLCVRYFDEKLADLRKPLNETSVTEIIADNEIKNGNVFYVGNPDIPQIVPLEKRPIPLHNYYKRPMIFILKEGVIESETQFVKTRRNLMTKIQRYACEVETGYKFIDYSKDHELLKDGDMVICLGPRGKEQYEFLKSIGYDINAITLDNLT